MIFNSTDPEIKIQLDSNPHRIFLFISNFINKLVLLCFLVWNGKAFHRAQEAY
jgi:hypothetical protein